MSSARLPILVTGAAGFIGARFVASCGDESVVSVDSLTHFNTRDEHRGIDFGKTVDREALFDWLEKDSPSFSTIVHMGACSRTTELDEAFLRRVNVEYSQKLWNYATSKKIPFIYASSAATYGDGSLGYQDDEALTMRLKPLNPYGESKRIFDQWVLERERVGSTPPAWAGFRFFNVYGFGERHKGEQASVVLHAFDQIKKSGRVRLFRSHRAEIGDGEQKRDFVLVDDAVQAMRFAIEKPIRRGIFNLGTGKARTFLDLAHAVFRALGKKPEIEFIDTPAAIRERYQYFTQAEMSKLASEGFARPFTSLEDGVQSYVRELEALNRA